MEYEYKARGAYYETLSDARNALRIAGWTFQKAKEKKVKIYKYNKKTRKLISAHNL